MASVKAAEGEPRADVSSRSNGLRQHAWYEGLPREVRNLLAGGVAGMVAKSFVAPIDRIKILYQISSAHFRLRDVPGVAIRIINKEGWTALWKGNMATMIRVFPYSGIQFMVFDRIKTHFLQRHEDGNHSLYSKRDAQGQNKSMKWGLSPLESLTSGAMAGAISVIATYPLDLTRAQLAVLKKKYDASGKRIHQSFATVLFRNYSSRVSRETGSFFRFFV